MRSTRLLSISDLSELINGLLPALGVWRRPRWRQGQALRVAYGQP